MFEGLDLMMATTHDESATSARTILRSPRTRPQTALTNHPPIRGDRIVIKAIVRGRCVGKTALLLRFEHAFDHVDTENNVKDMVKNFMITTYGADHTMVKMEPTNGTPTVMQILDTTGQERNNAITTSYYRNKQICFLVYDCTDPTSVYDKNSVRPNKHQLEQLYADAMENRRTEPLVFVVIGNKRDIADNDEKRFNKTKRLVDQFILDVREQSDKDYPAIALNVPPVSALKDSHVTFRKILSDISSVLAESAHTPRPNDRSPSITAPLKAPMVQQDDPDEMYFEIDDGDPDEYFKDHFQNDDTRLTEKRTGDASALDVPSPKKPKNTQDLLFFVDAFSKNGERLTAMGFHDHHLAIRSDVATIETAFGGKWDSGFTGNNHEVNKRLAYRSGTPLEALIRVKAFKHESSFVYMISFHKRVFDTIPDLRRKYRNLWQQSTNVLRFADHDIVNFCTRIRIRNLYNDSTAINALVLHFTQILLTASTTSDFARMDMEEGSIIVVETRSFTEDKSPEDIRRYVEALTKYGRSLTFNAKCDGHVIVFDHPRFQATERDRALTLAWCVSQIDGEKANVKDASHGNILRGLNIGDYGNALTLSFVKRLQHVLGTLRSGTTLTAKKSMMITTTPSAATITTTPSTTTPMITPSTTTTTTTSTTTTTPPTATPHLTTTTPSTVTTTITPPTMPEGTTTSTTVPAISGPTEEQTPTLPSDLVNQAHKKYQDSGYSERSLCQLTTDKVTDTVDKIDNEVLWSGGGDATLTKANSISSMDVLGCALTTGIQHSGRVLYESVVYEASLRRLTLTLTYSSYIMKKKHTFILAKDQEPMFNTIQTVEQLAFEFLAVKLNSKTKITVKLTPIANSAKQRHREVLDWKRAIDVTTKLEDNILRNKILDDLDDYEPPSARQVYKHRDMAGSRYSLVQKIALKSNKSEFVSKSQLVARDPKLARFNNMNILSEVQVLYEAVLTQVLEHPNVIKLWAINCRLLEDDLLDYTMVFECCAGGSLDDAIHNKDKKPLGNHVLEKIIRDLLSGLDFIHSKNIMHRDLKPANVGLTTNVFRIFDLNQNLVKIFDFGLSKDQGINYLVTKGIGTYLYMSPEILDPNCNSYDSSVDLYAVALIFYEMHARTRPYQDIYETATKSRNHFSVRDKIVDGTLRPNVDGFPPLLRRLIEALWHKCPQMRWKAKECIAFLNLAAMSHKQEGMFVKNPNPKLLEWLPPRLLLMKESGTTPPSPLRTPKRRLSRTPSPLKSPSSKVTSNTRAMFKAIMVGRGGVGKSALGIRLLHAYDSVDTEADVKKEVGHTITTIGVEDCIVPIEPIAGTETFLTLRDTAGQERFDAIARSFYRKQQMCFLVYDCTDPTSVYDENSKQANKHRMEQLYDDALEHRGPGEPAQVFVVIGNKRDIADNNENFDETKRLVDKFILDIREQSDEHYPAIALNVPPVSALKDSHATFQNILFQVSSVLSTSAHKPTITRLLTSPPSIQSQRQQQSNQIVVVNDNPSQPQDSVETKKSCCA